MGLPGLRCRRLPARGLLPPLGPALARRPLPRTSALRYSSLQAQGIFTHLLLHNLIRFGCAPTSPSPEVSNARATSTHQHTIATSTVGGGAPSTLDGCGSTSPRRRTGPPSGPSFNFRASIRPLRASAPSPALRPKPPTLSCRFAARSQQAPCSGSRPAAAPHRPPIAPAAQRQYLRSSFAAQQQAAAKTTRARLFF